MVQYALGMDGSGPVRIMPLGETTARERTLDISESAQRRDFITKWSKKTPPPEGLFTDEARFRPVTMEYANGTLLNFLPGITTATFHGERGAMEISRNKFVTDPVDLVTDTPDLSNAAKWEGGGHVARPHLQNWLDCIRSRNIPNASIEIGQRRVTVCHLAHLVRELNRPLSGNPATEQFSDDEDASKLLDRPRRGEFELPNL